MDSLTFIRSGAGVPVEPSRPNCVYLEKNELLPLTLDERLKGKIVETLYVLYIQCTLIQNLEKEWGFPSCCSKRMRGLLVCK